MLHDSIVIFLFDKFGGMEEKSSIEAISDFFLFLISFLNLQVQWIQSQISCVNRNCASPRS